MTPDNRRERADSFKTIGAQYHRLRPPFPDEVVDWMLPEGAVDVLDLGAGTGRLTDSLVARGLAVTAVDPSTSMLGVLRERLPEVRAVETTAESTGLPSGSFDAILVAQAWHWMDPAAASAEAARLLRPGGTLALVWNTHVPSAGWQEEFEAIQDALRGTALLGEGRPDVREPLGACQELIFRWSREVPAEDYLRIRTTHSPFMVADDATKADRLARWRALLDANAGDTVTEGYTTQAWRFTLG